LTRLPSYFLPPAIAAWFEKRGWSPRTHQLAMLEAAARGEHVLLSAPTGAGKTLAGFLPVLADLAEHSHEGLHTLYVSPLKALAIDVRRNLLTPIDEIGLPIRVEARTGDTPSDRKKRQREDPPHILLTTPESLNLLLSYPESFAMFAGLKTVIIDEVHAFATSKRGDLLALSLARMQAIAPKMRRVALSATLADPEAYKHWLGQVDPPLEGEVAVRSADGGVCPSQDIEMNLVSLLDAVTPLRPPMGATSPPRGGFRQRSTPVTLITGERGAEPDLAILLPEDRIPWGGHSGVYAVPQVMAEIETHQTTLVFCNTRGLAELIFQQLWAANELKLPIGIHHGSLDVEARRKVENAMADGKLRALVATASLDLGVDWGNVDCVIQMGAPKGASRLLQRIGRANHRLDEPSEAVIVPGNRFEYLEAQAALDAIAAHQLDGEPFRDGGLDVLAQHIMACACAAPFEASALFLEVTSAAPYTSVTRVDFDRLLHLIATGGYALKAYDRFARLVEEKPGHWRVTHPKFALQHRLNAGIIVDTPMLQVRFRNGRKLGQMDEYFASTLAPGDCFFFAGTALEVDKIDATDLYVRATSKRARIPSYMGARMPLTTHLADRVRGFLHDQSQWHRFPADVREWLEMQARCSILPAPDQLLVETFERDGVHYMVTYSFEGWNAHQSLAMLITKRMERRGLKPLGFVASDYAFAVWGLEPITDPALLFSSDILAAEFTEWIEQSALLKRAFREVAVISGLVERQQPGKRKTGRQVTFSTDLIYDVLRRYEPDHILLNAAWADARARMTDVGRLGALLDRAQIALVHKRLARISPLAVPVLVLIGREHISGGEGEEAILIEADALAREAMGA
jgi:ATP-dependent helicase Lhr and Lhr-like helicase